MHYSSRLSPTSYAMLGLLARGPQSAYQMNGVMQGSLMRVFWPRAESHVYSEPKKLLAHKLVSEQKKLVNGRKRTVYTITARGRSALKKWLQEEGSAELRMTSELMLKFLLAGDGQAGDGPGMLERSRDASIADLAKAIAGIEAILLSPGLASDGMPWNGIAINLMVDILIARHKWNTYALDTVTGVDESTAAEKETLGREAYALALKKMRDAIS